MKFSKLAIWEKIYIKSRYKETDKNKEISKDAVQEELSEMFNVSKRTIRTWIKTLGLVSKKHDTESKILIYDIETSRCTAKVWWTGKTYINHKQLTSEPKIISIAFKWLGDKDVTVLTWNENKNDKQLVEDFLKVYNTADMVIGQNNDRFDNRWINARAMKYRLEVNTFVKSFDIMKQTKRLFRLPSYSMDYVTKFLGVTNKLGHEGILMWDKIEDGTKEEHDEYLKKMCDYNIGDIIATEQMYVSLRKYMGNKVHFGVLQGKEKYTCPNCGSTDVELYKTTSTPAGTLQYIMKCNKDEVKYKLSHREYLKVLDNK